MIHAQGGHQFPIGSKIPTAEGLNRGTKTMAQAMLSLIGIVIPPDQAQTRAIAPPAHHVFRRCDQIHGAAAGLLIGVHFFAMAGHIVAPKRKLRPGTQHDPVNGAFIQREAFGVHEQVAGDEKRIAHAVDVVADLAVHCAVAVTSGNDTSVAKRWLHHRSPRNSATW